MPFTPITTNLVVLQQSVNIDIESMAPTMGFDPESYDVANSTITAVVQVPEDGDYRLALAMETEENTSAFVRIVSGSDKDFGEPAKFRRLRKNEAPLIQPLLAKAGIAIEGDLGAALGKSLPGFKVADIYLPAGVHTLRIHASQKLVADPATPKHFRFTIYAPQLSFIPASNVKLGVTVVFPLGFAAQIDEPMVEALPGQTPPVQDVFNHPEIGAQKSFGWAFHSDPKITISYTYL